MGPLRAAPYGVLPDGRAVSIHTLANARGMEVAFLSYGGIITRLLAPDRHGAPADVAPGYETLDSYLTDPYYFGPLIGRFANRIAGGRFTLDGEEYRIPQNDGSAALHGGPRGFNTALWRVEPFTENGSVGALLSHHSPDEDSGFPGALDVEVKYLLTEADELRIEYRARADRATPVNLTHHSYFNLGGHASGTVLDHELTIFASGYLPVNDARIPTGEIRPVAGGDFDFRRPRPIGGGEGRTEDPVGGYDHNFVLERWTPDEPHLAARLHEPRSGRVLEIETTEPGLQLYAGGRLGSASERPTKEGAVYGPYTALALETQHFPDSPNQPSFPSTILRPGEPFLSRTVYRFGAV